MKILLILAVFIALFSAALMLGLEWVLVAWVEPAPSKD